MIPREGKKPLVATWGGIPLIWDVTTSIEDERERYHWKRSELEQRLLVQVCEQCGATRMTAKIEVHRIRTLKDLEQHDGLVLGLPVLSTALFGKRKARNIAFDRTLVCAETKVPF